MLLRAAPALVLLAAQAAASFASIGDAKWGDAEPPYDVHTGQSMRIHGYLAAGK